MKPQAKSPPREATLQELLLKSDAAFWVKLAQETTRARSFDDLILLCTLRRRAEKRAIPGRPAPKKTLRRLPFWEPTRFTRLTDLLTQLLWASGCEPTLFVGEFDNHAVSEIAYV